MRLRIISTVETRRRGAFEIDTRRFNFVSFLILSLFLCVSLVQINAQNELPEPGPARPVNVPAVIETKLKNGLTVAVVEKKGAPLVSVQLLVRAGASGEGIQKAGLANLTADMLTKGTKTRTAEQIAEEMEFLGTSLNSGAGWNNSTVGMTVTTDKLDAAMAIMSDVVLNPAFAQKELDLLKSQTLDDLKYNLTQPGFLANYVASAWSYAEHPAGGTPASIESIGRPNIEAYFKSNYKPEHSVLIFVGDISNANAVKMAEKFFGNWKVDGGPRIATVAGLPPRRPNAPVVNRFLVVDLPDSGQSSVNYVVPIELLGRKDKDYYTASVLNSLLGGGYSSRLNQEIRIKRGLSYGAGSGFGWRNTASTFGASTQTKDQSAAEVAELIVSEINRLRTADPTNEELDPRKAVLTGGFGRNLETNAGLANALVDLYTFGIPTAELNAYVNNVNSVANAALKSFATRNFVNGDIIIVGDYSIFKEDLAKRFPDAKIEVVPAAELDITQPDLRRKHEQ